MNIYGFEALKKDGSVQSIADFKGKVMLIVNSATKCGFTPQYKDLKDLHEKYASKGLEILDFPCNQFGEQAPGTNEEIQEFCTLNFNTPYQLYAKIDVNGENESPLFAFLKSQKGFEGFNNPKHELNSVLIDLLSKQDPDYDKKPDIKWNFTKFLIDKEGNVVERFEPTADIVDITLAIENLL